MRARHQLLPLGPGSWSPHAWELLASGSGHSQAAVAGQLEHPGDAAQGLRLGVGWSQLAAASPVAARAPRLHGWPLGYAVVVAISHDGRGARPTPCPTYPS